MKDAGRGSRLSSLLETSAADTLPLHCMRDYVPCRQCCTASPCAFLFARSGVRITENFKSRWLTSGITEALPTDGGYFIHRWWITPSNIVEGRRFGPIGRSSYADMYGDMAREDTHLMRDSSRIEILYGTEKIIRMVSGTSRKISNVVLGDGVL
jgi:hypothetical protein